MRRAWTALSPDYDPNAGMNLPHSRSKKEQGTGCASSSARDRPAHQVGTTRQMLVRRHEGRRWAPKVSEWRDSARWTSYDLAAWNVEVDTYDPASQAGSAAADRQAGDHVTLARSVAVVQSSLVLRSWLGQTE